MIDNILRHPGCFYPPPSFEKFSGLPWIFGQRLIRWSRVVFDWEAYFSCLCLYFDWDCRRFRVKPISAVHAAFYWDDMVLYNHDQRPDLPIIIVVLHRRCFSNSQHNPRDCQQHNWTTRFHMFYTALRTRTKVWANLSRILFYFSSKGLFKPQSMNYEIDRDPDNEPSLSEMVQKTIEILRKNTNGYFLFVEGGKIGKRFCNILKATIFPSLSFNRSRTPRLQRRSSFIRHGSIRRCHR